MNNTAPMERLEMDSAFSSGEYEKAENQSSKPYKTVLLNPFFLYLTLAISAFALITGHFLVLPIAGIMALIGVPIAAKIFKLQADKTLKTEGGIKRVLIKEVRRFNKRVEFFNHLLNGYLLGHVDASQIAALRSRLEQDRRALEKRISFYYWLENKPGDTPYSHLIGDANDCADMEDLDKTMLEVGAFREKVALEEAAQSEAEKEGARLLNK